MIRALALCLIASPALAAETVCLDRAELIATLDTRYGQRQTVRSVVAQGQILEIYVSPKGEWTMVLVPPEPGTLKACFVASGTGFMMIIPGIDG